MVHTIYVVTFGLAAGRNGRPVAPIDSLMLAVPSKDSAMCKVVKWRDPFQYKAYLPLSQVEKATRAFA